jgi:4,5-DOPA dioxygenase extradiol
MNSTRMPVLFVGHGSPMNAIEDNEFSQTWSKIGNALPRPKAILSISAHWETRGTSITGAAKPITIHDFAGFPQELFQINYPAEGSSWLVERVKATLDKVTLGVDQSWGLDHGTWSVLRLMYPKADIPVVQLSLNRTNDIEFHYMLGKWLQPLRDEGVLIMGSGNIVHNLREAVFNDSAYDWAVEFDAKVKDWIVNGNHENAILYKRHGKSAALAVNTEEHYLPLLYVLGASEPGEEVKFYCEKVTMGSISMRCVLLG